MHFVPAIIRQTLPGVVDDVHVVGVFEFVPGQILEFSPPRKEIAEQGFGGFSQNLPGVERLYHRSMSFAAVSIEDVPPCSVLHRPRMGDRGASMGVRERDRKRALS
jgi:hypothetical protein